MDDDILQLLQDKDEQLERNLADCELTLLPDADPRPDANPDPEPESPSFDDPLDDQSPPDVSAPETASHSLNPSSRAASSSTSTSVDRLNGLISSSRWRRRRHSPKAEWPTVAQLISRVLPYRVFQKTVTKVALGVPQWFSPDERLFGALIGNLSLEAIDTINEQLTHDIAFLYHTLSLPIDCVVALEFYASEIGAQLVLDALEQSDQITASSSSSESAVEAAIYFVYPAVCSLLLALKCARHSVDLQAEFDVDAALADVEFHSLHDLEEFARGYSDIRAHLATIGHVMGWLVSRSLYKHMPPEGHAFRHLYHAAQRNLAVIRVSPEKATPEVVARANAERQELLDGDYAYLSKVLAIDRGGLIVPRPDAVPFYFWLDCGLSAVLTHDGADRLKQPRLWAIHRTEAFLSSSTFRAHFQDLLHVMYGDHASDPGLADFTFKRMIRPFLTLKQGEFVKLFSDWIKQEQVDPEQNDHRQRIRLLLVKSKSTRNQHPPTTTGLIRQQNENAGPTVTSPTTLTATMGAGGSNQPSASKRRRTGNFSDGATAPQESGTAATPAAAPSKRGGKGKGRKRSSGVRAAKSSVQSDPQLLPLPSPSLPTMNDQHQGPGAFPLPLQHPPVVAPPLGLPPPQTPSSYVSHQHAHQHHPPPPPPPAVYPSGAQAHGLPHAPPPPPAVYLSGTQAAWYDPSGAQAHGLPHALPPPPPAVYPSGTQAAWYDPSGAQAHGLPHALPPPPPAAYPSGTQAAWYDPSGAQAHGLPHALPPPPPAVYPSGTQAHGQPMSPMLASYYPPSTPMHNQPVPSHLPNLNNGQTHQSHDPHHVSPHNSSFAS